MVSGFLISPYDQDRIFSGLAIEIRIWSKTCAGNCGLKRFMISWFIAFSVWSYLGSGRRRTGDGRQTKPCVPFFSVLCRPSSIVSLLGGFRRSLGASLLRIVQVDVETERTHLLDQHVEALGNARLERVVAAHDRLVDLGAAGDVVRLDGEHLLQRVGGAVGFERPDLHFAE